MKRRPGANARGYTYRWQQYRERWLQDHPLCGDREGQPSAEHSACLAAGRTTPATDVDHIQRVSGPDDPLFWQTGNHQSLCHGCHSAKTATEMTGRALRQQVGADGWPVTTTPPRTT